MHLVVNNLDLDKYVWLVSTTLDNAGLDTVQASPHKADLFLLIQQHGDAPGVII